MNLGDGDKNILSSPISAPSESFPVTDQVTNIIKRSASIESNALFVEIDPFAPPPRLSQGFSKVASSTAATPTKASTFSAAVTPTSARKSRPIQEPIDVFKNLPPYSGGHLFEQLCSPGLAVKTLIDEWLTDYESIPDTASLSLINLILWTARVENNDITPTNFVTDSASQILSDLQENIDPTSSKPNDFPLSEKSKKFRTFRQQFSEFWSMWTASVMQAVENIDAIRGVIIPWIISMTSAGYRPIRLAATTAVLDIVLGCCKACVTMQRDLDKTSRVLSTKRGMASKKSVEFTSARIADLEKLMQLAIDAVFVQRYRDVDSCIRETCVKHLLTWIDTYPEVFLDNSYLRYVGWSLSDKVAVVRQASLEAWLHVCGRAEFRPVLSNFVGRLKNRLMEVLIRDVDRNCRQLAAQVVDSLYLGSFLSQEELAFVDDLIYAGEPTISNLKECMSMRILGHSYEKYGKEAVADSINDTLAATCLERTAVFISPYMNSETSAETNNSILKQLLVNLKDSFKFVMDLPACSTLLKDLISRERPESEEASDAESDKISNLLAIMYAQVQCVKSSRGSSWRMEDSQALFEFVNSFIKFINDNEREIYSKDIFYLFSLLNQVDLSCWNDIAGSQTWEVLIPILMELFCSIDDLESARAALSFFKKARSLPILQPKVAECFLSARQRLLHDLARKTPTNMREALKIRDSSILTLILPLSQMNLMSSLDLEDVSTTINSILNMTKLVDEFVEMDQLYKTIIWTSSVRLAFHELMWSLMECRKSSTLEGVSVALDLRHRLCEMLNAKDYLPENISELDTDAFERAATCVNLLADLALLFTQQPGNVASSSYAEEWGMVLLDEQVTTVVDFFKFATRLSTSPLPSRNDDSFGLVRLAKKLFPGLVASMAKLCSLELVPRTFSFVLYATYGMVDDTTDAMVKLVLDRNLRPLAWKDLCPVIVAALETSYLVAVMSPDYERLVTRSTIPLARLFGDCLRQSMTDDHGEMAVAEMHETAIAFFQANGHQRAEFLGRVMVLFANHVTRRDYEHLSGLLKACPYTDSYTRSYGKALERNAIKSNVAQRLLHKRIGSVSVSTPTKISRIEEECDATVESEAVSLSLEDADDESLMPPEMDAHTQLRTDDLEKEQLMATPTVPRRTVMKF